MPKNAENPGHPNDHPTNPHSYGHVIPHSDSAPHRSSPLFLEGRAAGDAGPSTDI